MKRRERSLLNYTVRGLGGSVNLIRYNVDTTTSTLIVETQLSVIKSTVTFQPLTVHKVIIWIELVSNYKCSYPLQLKANLH